MLLKGLMRKKPKGRKAMSFKLFARAPPARRKGKGTRSVANPCFATPRRRREGMCEVLRTEQIPEREEFTVEILLS